MTFNNNTGHTSAGNTYYFIGKLLISAGLIVFLFYQINISNIISAVKNADILLISACFLMMFINLYLQYIKWKTAAGRILGRLEGREVFFSLFYGLSGGAFTPARLGEYWGRSIAIKDKSLMEVTAATIIDKLFPLGIVLFVGLCGTSWYYHITGKFSIYLPVLFTMLLSVLSIIMIANANSLLKYFSFLKKYSIVKKNAELIKSIVTLEKKFIVKMIFISACFFFCYILQYAVLVSAFSHNLFTGKYLLAGIMVMFSKTLLGSVSLSEFGIREGASVYFLSVLGESSETGFNASLFLFIINVVIPSLFGLIIMTAGKNVK